MDLFEYQGKQVLARYGIPVTSGRVAGTVDEAVAAAEEVGYPAVVKAQVRIGGRGKAGGIKLGGDAGEVRGHAERILGMDIRGHVVRRLLIERATDIGREWYASFTLDRAARQHLAMVSARGGVDIEQVAAEEPTAIARVHIDPVDGLSEDGARRLVAEAGLDDDVSDETAAVLLSLYRCYVEGDAELVEVNPLVRTAEGRVLALDAKVSVDGNARFRHPEWEEYAADEVVDPRERMARERGLQYVGLSGEVGVIANGAGLAMSTLDVVSQVGGRPANFLDVGGGARADVMASALEVVDSDPAVRAILVNIFGGITRGEEVANGVVDALGRVGLRSPIVVRLDGTNAEEGRAILAAHESDRLVSRPTMVEAARTAVELAAAAANAPPTGEG